MYDHGVAGAQREILLDAFGGAIVRTGRRVDASYRTPLITLGLSLVVVAWSLGALAMLAAVVVNGAPLGILAGAALGGVGAGAMLALVRYRVRSMGRVVLDFERGVMTKVARGDRVLATWPLPAVRFESRWDPFHRGFGTAHWLIARTPDGRTLRLGKSDRGAIARAIAQLEALRAP